MLSLNPFPRTKGEKVNLVFLNFINQPPLLPFHKASVAPAIFELSF